jgi:hypothetical protein
MLVFACHPQQAEASSPAGGELIYEWISDSTYRFFFKYYNDCAGDTADTVQTICLYNTCQSANFTRTMTKWINGVGGGGPPGPPSPGCQSMKTKCDSPSSVIPGYKEHWYTSVVALPAKCSLWKFSVTVSARNSSNNLNPATGKNNLYVEATLNNTTINHNSSPYFTIKPIPYVCSNNTYNYNNGAIDPDGDSIITEIIRPMTKTSSCTDIAENIPFASASPAYSIPSNPFQTNNSLTAVARTGQITFTATTPGANTLAVRVKEYRNGVLIGSVSRDITLNVFPCISDSPKVIVDAGSVTGGYYQDSTIYGCAGQPLSFCWDTKATNPATIFSVSDNHGFLPALQTAAITYTHNRTDSVRGCFTWTPKAKDIGLFGFIVSVKDSTCRPPNIMLYYTLSIPIHIWGPVSTANDTTICLGKSVKLKAKNGGDYNWSVLSGSAGGIVCSTCDSTIVKPSFKTTYHVVSTASAFCGNNMDTVTVTVLPSIPSSVFILASDTNIKEGDKVIVSALGVNCPHPQYQWQINGITIPNTDTGKLIIDSLKDLDTLTCRLICADTCANPADTTSNSLVFHVKPKPVSVNSLGNAVAGVRIYPNPNNGNFTLSGNVSGMVDIHILNTMGQIVYSDKIDVAGSALNKQIELRDMPNGIYILQVSSPEGIQTLRFNIQP